LGKPGAGVKFSRLTFIFGFLGLLAACTTLAPTSSNLSPNEATYNPTEQSGYPATATAFQPAVTPEDFAAVSLYLSPYLPPAVQASLSLPPDIGLAAKPEAAHLRLDIGEDNVISRWVFAAVAPFPTLTDEVSLADLRAAWAGTASNRAFSGPLLMSEQTFPAFERWWGRPGSGAVVVLPAASLLEYTWNHRPAWAIVPFEALEPQWKVLVVDGVSPVRKEFEASNYALSLPISLYGDPGLVQIVLSYYGPTTPTPMLPPSNRDADQLTTLVMTGVTALVRATAWAMENKGITYPGEAIGEFLRNADLTHISNEVPFAPDCPPPNPSQEDMRFCSDPRYIELLDYVGTDIMELTGDHFGDWGAEAMEYTLGMYQQRGWLYYGGGHNLEEGRRAITLEHNHNRLAFIGCNAKGGGYATASATHPGAAKCDYDWMQAEVARLTQAGYLVIATFQHYEYYTYVPQDPAKMDFRPMAEAGAVIVSGSQAHQAHGMEFHSGGLIMYGLGNLFFDQYGFTEDTRQALIARHVFYDGRHISTEIITIYFVDWAKPRFATPAERLVLLQNVFSASGW
jgi:poly-gamma-glutamate synthesis protein (capsule biosynthesis protein)